MTLFDKNIIFTWTVNGATIQEIRKTLYHIGLNVHIFWQGGEISCAYERGYTCVGVRILTLLILYGYYTLAGIFDSGLYILSLTAVFWAPVLLMSYVSTQYTKILGRRITLLLGCVGVPIHELSHLMMCKFIGLFADYQVTRVSFYSPKVDGSLGFVQYQYKPNAFSPIFNIAIGIAPLIGGIFTFILVTAWLRPDLDIVELHRSFLNEDGINKALLLLDAITQGASLYSFIAWCLISLSVLLFCCPSKADFLGCRPGIIYIAAVLMMLFYVLPGEAISIMDWMLPYLTFMGSFLVFSVAVMTVFLLFLTVIRKLKRY